jgi:hypothetical protein
MIYFKRKKRKVHKLYQTCQTPWVMAMKIPVVAFASSPPVYGLNKTTSP